MILSTFCGFCQVVLLVCQGVLGGPRQKRPLDLGKAVHNEEPTILLANSVNAL